MKTKIYFLALIWALGILTVQAQTNLFDKLSDRDDVSVVYISKALLSMVPDVGASMTGGADIKSILNKMEQLEIYSSENKEIANMIRKEVTTLTNTKKYDKLMTVKDKSDKVTFFANKENDVFKDLIMFVDNEGECTLIRIIGTFTAKDIQDITTNN